jgi:hypothetical protein
VDSSNNHSNKHQIKRIDSSQESNRIDIHKSKNQKVDQEIPYISENKLVEENKEDYYEDNVNQSERNSQHSGSSSI